jgi:hypothetical protein
MPATLYLCWRFSGFFSRIQDFYLHWLQYCLYAGFLKRNLKTSNTNIKLQAYLSLVRPKLEYACSVWDPHTAEHRNTIEMVQRRTARYACNQYHNTSSITDMLQTLTWPTLQQRRLKTKLIMLYKIVLTPYRCSSYYNINTNRFKNRTISFFHIQSRESDFSRYRAIISPTSPGLVSSAVWKE